MTKLMGGGQNVFYIQLDVFFLKGGMLDSQVYLRIILRMSHNNVLNLKNVFICCFSVTVNCAFLLQNKWSKLSELITFQAEKITISSKLLSWQRFKLQCYEFFWNYNDNNNNLNSSEISDYNDFLSILKYNNLTLTNMCC